MSDRARSGWWSGMGDGRARARAISTVADVSIALLIVVASIALVAGALDSSGSTHEPAEAPHTAETLGSSTFAVNYSLEPAFAAADSEWVDDPGEYDDDELVRTTHAPALGHLARAALLDVLDTSSGRERPDALDYESRIDERLQTSLVASSFQTNVTAVWEPFEDASIRGTTSVGQHPPHQADTSLVTMTVPSELPSVREDALAAVDDDDAYGSVAEIVARAYVEGRFPLPETERVLERDGPGRDHAVYRYLRTVNLVSGTDREHPAVADNLEREEVDAAALNDHLIDRLGAQLESELKATFDTAGDAAAAVSTGEVTISITTWNDDSRR
jgi:hypothetical protein